VDLDIGTGVEPARGSATGGERKDTVDALKEKVCGTVESYRNTTRRDNPEDLDTNSNRLLLLSLSQLASTHFTLNIKIKYY
jgi:hypothetical protein